MRARPAETDGTHSLALAIRAIRGSLVPEVSANGRDVRFGDAQAGAIVLTDAGLSVVDADGREIAARFAVCAGGLHLSVDDRGARYPLTIDPVVQQAYLKASNTDVGDVFGSPVEVSGDRVVVGALDEASSATGVDGNQSDNSAQGAGAANVFDVPSGSFATYGTGTPGKGGFVPNVVLSGSPMIGDDVTLSISDGRGGADALMLIGFARANIPFAGGEILVETPWVMVNLVLGGTPGVPGAGALDVTDSIPDDPSLVGVVVDFQVLVADRSAYKKLALSNGAELVIGG